VYKRQVLAWKLTGAFSLPVFAWSVFAVILIMLTTYASGEFYDLDGDRLTAKMEKNFFSGGSQAVVEGLIPPAYAKVTSYMAGVAAGIIGLILQFYYKTGPWTIPLGTIGLFSGFFYSTEPIRLVKRGIGELFIGFCYGWLPVATAFYLQTSRFSPLAFWMSIPSSITIFSVILINEFPDYPADRIEGKANLVVRFGKKAGSMIYAVAGIATVISFAAGIAAGAPRVSWAFLPLVATVSLVPAWKMARGEYTDRKKLERLCAATLVLNLLVAAAYIAGLLL
jgi:1,4-dihydroxy-2-naphthoate octaprenyltransferase